MRSVKYQGQCGSCWAVSAAGALEAHLELATGNFTSIDYTQLVDCVPNPRKCGGPGGCDGATAEVAFDYVKVHGVAVEGDSEWCGDSAGATRVVTQSFVQLPANRELSLLEALALHGPVSVGADASDWYHYDEGVYGDCELDAELNHAVLAVGYGFDDELQVKYFILRNSWGSGWGEDGFIRLLRVDRADTYCGTDRNPSNGVGCEGGPSEMKVCGMCGILADASYPVGPSVVTTPSARPSFVMVEDHRRGTWEHQNALLTRVRR